MTSALWGKGHFSHGIQPQSRAVQHQLQHLLALKPDTYLSSLCFYSYFGGELLNVTWMGNTGNHRRTAGTQSVKWGQWYGVHPSVWESWELNGSWWKRPYLTDFTISDISWVIWPLFATMGTANVWLSKLGNVNGRRVEELSLPGNWLSVMCNQNNLNSHTHGPSTEIKVIALWKGWTETEMHLPHKALIKDSLRWGDL